MSKIRIIYVVSLAILGVLVVFTIFRPMATDEKYSTVARQSILQTEDEYIIQYDIINKEDEDTDYIINWSTGGETYYSETVSIKNGRTFTHIHHVYPETVKEDKVHLTICKEGEATPFEQCAYFIQFDLR